MQLSKILKILGIFMAGFLVVACLGFLYRLHINQSRPDYRPDSEIVIGWIGPLTGPSSILGIDNLKATELAAKEYNSKVKPGGQKIKLISFDDNYQTEKSLEAYHKLISDYQPSVIFLNTYSAMFSVGQFAKKDRVIIINSVDNDSALSKLSPNIFLIGKNTEGMADILAKAIISSGKTSIAIINFNGDAFMSNLAAALKDDFANFNGDISQNDYPPNTTNFTNHLQGAMQKNADAYVFLGYSEIGQAMKQARNLGITAPFYAVNNSMASSAGTAINGLQFAGFSETDGNLEMAKNFLQKFQNAYGASPLAPWTAMQAYDASNIVFSGLKKSLSLKGNFIENTKTALLNTKNYPGVCGNLTINSDGTTSGINWSMYNYNNGKVSK